MLSCFFVVVAREGHGSATGQSHSASGIPLLLGGNLAAAHRGVPWAGETVSVRVPSRQMAVSLKVLGLVHCCSHRMSGGRSFASVGLDWPGQSGCNHQTLLSVLGLCSILAAYRMGPLV